MIIALLGIDGAGKTTTGRLLTEQLRTAAYPATFSPNQSGRRSMTAWSHRRNLQPPVVLLDAIETGIRCVNVLISHLRARRSSGAVVMDRYLHCQLALRRVRGIREGWFLTLLLKVIPALDIIFYFDIDPEIAHARIDGRATDQETLEHLGAFDRAYKGLPQFPSFIVIDATQSAEQIVENILRELGVCGLGLQG
ncbi:dTMP kinase [Arthrobacter sp. TB 23]|uniref:dTMP kinase n=1 Tax=Arthrobacter sp. TB 23 TaxID=494419 RepID=UPI00031FD418|nr:dTMP kinase [Arthrobacter sp. TB 23]